MREVLKRQASLGEFPIEAIVLDAKSRDDIPKLLVGLQHIYMHPELRDEVFAILQEVLPCHADGKIASSALGRPGMEQWKILVLGVVRLGLDADYDRLQDLASQHKTLRQMLGHADWYDLHTYELQTLKDNLRLFTPEVLERINAAVVRAGHSPAKKSPEEVLKGRCDSFVVETDVHFPTDINLLHDAIRKTIECSAEVSEKLGLKGWRQSRYNLRQFKKSYRKIQQLKRSTSKDEAVREAKKKEIRDAHKDYIAEAAVYLQRANQTRIEAVATPGVSLCDLAMLSSLDGYRTHAERQIDQIRRRVLAGEVIPHHEKVFSIFEPHTEWISKGKAGVPVELGLRVCILEDQHGFVLHHQVMKNRLTTKSRSAWSSKARRSGPRFGWSASTRVSTVRRIDSVSRSDWTWSPYPRKAATPPLIVRGKRHRNLSRGAAQAFRGGIRDQRIGAFRTRSVPGPWDPRIQTLCGTGRSGAQHPSPGRRAS